MREMIVPPPEHCPTLSIKGELAIDVLNMMDGRNSLEVIAAYLQKRDPLSYGDTKAAMTWLYAFIKNYGT